MTLRVPFWVNDQKIAEVEIRRTFTDLTGPGIHRYVWKLSTWTQDGNRRTSLSSILDHRESDGATVLIRKVLEQCDHVPLHAGAAQ